MTINYQYIAITAATAVTYTCVAISVWDYQLSLIAQGFFLYILTIFHNNTLK